MPLQGSVEASDLAPPFPGHLGYGSAVGNGDHRLMVIERAPQRRSTTRPRTGWRCALGQGAIELSAGSAANHSFTAEFWRAAASTDAVGGAAQARQVLRSRTVGPSRDTPWTKSVAAGSAVSRTSLPSSALRISRCLHVPERAGALLSPARLPRMGVLRAGAAEPHGPDVCRPATDRGASGPSTGCRCARNVPHSAPPGCRTSFSAADRRGVRDSADPRLPLRRTGRGPAARSRTTGLARDRGTGPAADQSRSGRSAQCCAELREETSVRPRPVRL